MSSCNNPFNTAGRMLARRQINPSIPDSTIEASKNLIAFYALVVPRLLTNFIEGTLKPENFVISAKNGTFTDDCQHAIRLPNSFSYEKETPKDLPNSPKNLGTAWRHAVALAIHMHPHSSDEALAAAHRSAPETRCCPTEVDTLTSFGLENN